MPFVQFICKCLNLKKILYQFTTSWLVPTILLYHVWNIFNGTKFTALLENLHNTHGQMLALIVPEFLRNTTWRDWNRLLAIAAIAAIAPRTNPNLNLSQQKVSLDN